MIYPDSHWASVDSLLLVLAMVEQKVIKNNDYVVVLDLAPVHASQDFLTRFAGEHPYGHLVFVPPRMTSVCQPLDMAYMSRDDEADTLLAEPEVTIDDHVDDGEEEVEEVPIDERKAGEVDWTEVTLPAEAEPVKITKFMALRLVYGSASQKDLAGSSSCKPTVCSSKP
eukprot:3352074-Amphidinium_carterae.2